MSNSEMIAFRFEEQVVRTKKVNKNELLFNANDVCGVLGYGNPRQALTSHVDADDVQEMDTIDSMGRKQQANFITEPGLYSLIMGSKLEKAKRFKHWVTHEVLPSIRKTGSYTVPKAPRVAVVSAKSEAALLNAKVRFMKMMNEQVAEVTDGRNLSRDIIAVVRISILEQQVGISLKELLPVNVTRWEAPSDIAKRLGSTPHAIGCIISTIPQLAARGNIDGYCRAVTNKALHSDRIVESFQYTPAAVALIEAQFAQRFNVPISIDRLLPD